jgi:hypothetical protein
MAKYYYRADIIVKNVEIVVEADNEQEAKRKIYSNPFESCEFEEYDLYEIYYEEENIQKI